MALKQYFALNHPIALKRSYYNGVTIIKIINEANILYKKCRATNKHVKFSTHKMNNKSRCLKHCIARNRLLQYVFDSMKSFFISCSRWKWNFPSSFKTSLLMILANTFWRRPCYVSSSPMSMSLSISWEHSMIWIWLRKYLLFFKKSSMIATAQYPDLWEVSTFCSW